MKILMLASLLTACGQSQPVCTPQEEAACRAECPHHAAPEPVQCDRQFSCVSNGPELDCTFGAFTFTMTQN